MELSFRLQEEGGPGSEDLFRPETIASSQG
jgi:hypothetical protein